MDDDAFDRTLIGAAFAQAAELGWRHVSVVGAARAAGLPLARARARFPGRAALLLRFGRIADEAALAGPVGVGSVRDQLFDLIMRRIDVLQVHRAGVLALLRALPCEPPTAVLLACATRRGLRWLAQAAGVELSGLRGELTLRGLIAVWLWTLRAWERDESTDLSATMAALDSALSRAEQAARWLQRRAAPGHQPQSGSGPESDYGPGPAPVSESEPEPVSDPETVSESGPAPESGSTPEPAPEAAPAPTPDPEPGPSWQAEPPPENPLA